MTGCQLTGHAEYLALYSICPLIHVGSMETIEEQTSNIEGESPEELTPDEQQQGLAARAASPQRAGPLPSGCSPSTSRAPTPWMLALSEQGPAPGLLALNEQGPAPWLLTPQRAGPLPLAARPQLAGPCPWLLAISEQGHCPLAARPQ